MNKNYLFIIALMLYAFAGIEAKAGDDRTKHFPKVEVKPSTIPTGENVWVFILAGQSNMAGRGQVEPSDTIPNDKILSINKLGEIIIAKEPLHFYEPSMTGLDCGLTFANELLNHIPDSITLVLIPTAVGGSSINQWINDSTFRNVPLFSNFKEKVEIGRKIGNIKGILWIQGESDASTTERIKIYDEKLNELFGLFRKEAGNKTLPIFVGEIGSFSKNDENWQAINEKIRKYVKTDSNAHLIGTSDLKDKGDRVHFNAEGQREIGKRFVKAFIETQK